MRAGTAIVGSPETVLARVEEDMTTSACNYFVGRFAFGDASLPELLNSIGLFSARVMPGFRSSDLALRI